MPDEKDLDDDGNEWSAGVSASHPDYLSAATDLLMRWAKRHPELPPNVSLALGFVCYKADEYAEQRQARKSLGVYSWVATVDAEKGQYATPCLIIQTPGGQPQPMSLSFINIKHARDARDLAQNFSNDSKLPVRLLGSHWAEVLEELEPQRILAPGGPMILDHQIKKQ